jgi:hypothetical protein
MRRFRIWKIVHVAARESLPDLTAEPEWGGLLLSSGATAFRGPGVDSSLAPPLTSSQLAAVLPELIARLSRIGSSYRLSGAASGAFAKAAPTGAPDLTFYSLRRPSSHVPALVFQEV